jgi:hypothetical protein
MGVIEDSSHLTVFGREDVARQPTVWRKGGLYGPLKVLVIDKGKTAYKLQGTID